MKFSFDTKQYWIPGTYYHVDRKGNKTLRYYDGEEYIFNHTAYKSPTKHLILYKYLKRFINKLCSILDSNFFYESI